MSTKHTPGPWTKWELHAEVYSGVRENTDSGLRGFKGKPMHLIASCDNDDGLEEEVQEANAMLISAAPDMAAALMLQRCSQCMGHEPDADVCDACRAKRAALRKAGVLP